MQDNSEPGCCGLFNPMYCTFKCWQFIISVIISFTAMAIGVVGLLGLFAQGDQQFFTYLILFTLGVWVPTPNMSKEVSTPNITIPEEPKKKLKEVL